MKCKCCNREKELRMGYCFDCVEAESILATGLDMFDQPVPKEEGMSQAMSNLKFILKKYTDANAPRKN